MTSRAPLRAVLLLLLIGGAIAAAYYLRLPGPSSHVEGWIEADLIFVSPDEVGRIETLSVREGSHIQSGAPLFTLDDGVTVR